MVSKLPVLQHISRNLLSKRSFCLLMRASLPEKSIPKQTAWQDCWWGRRECYRVVLQYCSLWDEAHAAVGAEQGSIQQQSWCSILGPSSGAGGTARCQGVMGAESLPCHAQGAGERLFRVNWYTCGLSLFHTALNKGSEFYLEMEVCHYSFLSQKRVCLPSKQIQSFHTFTLYCFYLYYQP